MEAAEFVRALRMRHGEQARAIPLDFARRLMAAVESGEPEPDGSSFEPVSRLLHERLPDRHVDDWRSAVLDEVGMLAESLRER